MEIKHINIKNIKDPSFLKTMSYREMNVLASDIRNEIINVTAKNGGHVSSNLGVVELILMLHKNFDFAKDRLLLDVGHQCYTHKILTGRNLDDLRQKDGISGFQKRHESIYDCFEAGHSSTSLSTAHGMAIARDLKNEKHEVIAVIGDGSLASGLAFEGLNNIVHTNSKVIIILNDNGMSISKATGGTARFLHKIRASVSYNRTKKAYQKVMCKTRFGLWLYSKSSNFKNRFKSIFLSRNIFDTLGYVYFGPVDGHDVKALNRALKRASRSAKSVVVHVHTIKGKGFPFAEKDNTGFWHGVGPYDAVTGISLNPNNKAKSWSEVYAELLDCKMENDKNIVLINPAMITGSKLETVFLHHPEHCFDVGICEEHAITMASGLALAAMHPIVSVYSTFLQRAYDEVNHDLARMNLSSTLLIDRAGLVGADGETHQGIFDESLLYGMPNTVIAMASNTREAEHLFLESLKPNGVFAIRYPRDFIIKEIISDYPLSFGAWLSIINKEQKNVLVTFGPMLDKIVAEIRNKLLNCDVINALYQKPILPSNVAKLLNYQNVIIYNPYATEHGFCNNLTNLLIAVNYQGKITSISLPEAFIKHGTIAQQLEESKADVLTVIKKLEHIN